MLPWEEQVAASFEHDGPLQNPTFPDQCASSPVITYEIVFRVSTKDNINRARSIRFRVKDTKKWLKKLKRV